MKKLFSLVALAGMFLLMSFSTSIELQPTPTEDECYANGVAIVDMVMFFNVDLSPEEQHTIHGIVYDDCMGL